MAEAAAGSIDLVSLLTAGQQMGQQTTANLAALDAATGIFTESGKAAATAARDAAAADAEAIRLRGEHKLQEQANSENIMSIFGTNPKQADATMLTLKNRILADGEEIRASKKAITDKMSVGITDDLIGWISNQFTLPTDIAIHNVKVAARDADTNTLQALQKETIDQLAIAHAADAGTTSAIIAAESRKALALGIENAARWDFQTQQLGIHGITVRSALQHQELDTSFKMFAARNAQDSLNLSREAGVRDQQRLKLQQEVEGFKVKAMKREEDGIKGFEDRYNTVRASLNLPPSTWFEFQRMPAGMKSDWDKLLNDPNLTSGRLGYTPAESLALARNNNIKLPGASGATAEYVESVYQTISKDPTWKSLGKEGQIAKLNESVKAKLTLESANVPLQGGLLSIGSLQSVSKIVALQQDPATKLLLDDLAPLAKDPMYNTKATDFFASAKKLVAEGKIDVDTASAKIATIFKAAAQDNAEVKQLRRFAISGKFSETYNTTVSTGFGFGANTGVNMANDKAVKNILLRQIRQDEVPNSRNPLSITSLGGS